MADTAIHVEIAGFSVVAWFDCFSRRILLVLMNVMTKMFGSGFGLMLAIGRDGAPGKLERHHQQQKNDQALGHGLKLSSVRGRASSEFSIVSQSHGQEPPEYWPPAMPMLGGKQDALRGTINLRARTL